MANKMRTTDEDREAIAVERLSKRFVPTGRTQFTPPVPLVSRLRGKRWTPAEAGDGDDDELDDAALDDGEGLPPVADRVVWALRDVSLAVPVGATLAIVGPRGAGKTTLLRVLSGISPPTTGRVTLRGPVFGVIDLATAFMRTDAAPAANVLTLARITGGSRALARRCMPEILRFAGAEDIGPGIEYSKGVLRHLALATGLHLDHDILLVDDLGGLDPEFRAACVERLEQRATGGATAVIVSGDLDVLDRLCTHALWLEDGQVAQAGEAAQVLATYRKSLEGGKRQAASLASPAAHGETEEPVPGRAQLPAAKAGFSKLAAVMGARVHDVHGQATDVVREDEPFDVEVELEIGGYAVLSRCLIGFAHGEGGGGPAVLEPEPRPYDGAGRYTLTARLAAGALPPGTYAGRVNAVVTREGIGGPIGREELFTLTVVPGESELPTIEVPGEGVAEIEDATLWDLRAATWAVRAQDRR